MPDVEPDQPEQEIPIEPKMSNVPELQGNLKKQKIDTSLLVPTTQEDEIMPAVLEIDKINKIDSISVDTLKLEQKKELMPEIKNENELSTPNNLQDNSELKTPDLFQ